MIHGKHLELADLHVNMKIRVRSLTDTTGHVMVIHRINGTEITAVTRSRFHFTFYAHGVTFSDGIGTALLVTRYRREVI